MDDKDTAITELAHVAASLLTALRDAKAISGSIDAAISNKIEYYRSFAESA